ncbi:hypothetical protein [Streptomyces laurentii]|uniref:hypothetical protein n=1 Tax=Streptomyces laurentii TaxID=39478 RepID=UPI0033C25250
MIAVRVVLPVVALGFYALIALWLAARGIHLIEAEAPTFTSTPDPEVGLTRGDVERHGYRQLAVAAAPPLLAVAAVIGAAARAPRWGHWAVSGPVVLIGGTLLAAIVAVFTG